MIFPAYSLQFFIVSPVIPLEKVSADENPNWCEVLVPSTSEKVIEQDLWDKQKLVFSILYSALVALDALPLLSSAPENP